MVQIIMMIINIINFLAIFYMIFKEKRSANSIIAWVLVIYIAPVIGFIAFLLVGRKMNNSNMFGIKEIEAKLFKDYIKQIHKEGYIEKDNKNFDMINSIEQMGHSPYRENNEVMMYSDGKEFFTALLDALRKAEKCINIEFYIFKIDGIGSEILSILEEKAAKGVEVRLLYDSVGSRTLNKRVLKNFISVGGKTGEFFPSWLKIINLNMNFRNHRKIVVIDGEIGYVGGFNVGNEYVNRGHQFKFWRDTHLKVKGQAVNELNKRFILDWDYASDENLDNIIKYFPKPKEYGDVGIQIVSSGPDHMDEYIKIAYMKIINNARKYVYIQTPYLVPDEPMLEALRISALSGVDVRIIVPGAPDHFFMEWVLSANIANLIDYGVKIYRYNNGFIHAKTIVSDDIVSSIGTANMDNRSFRLNFEVNAFIYDGVVAKQQAKIFLNDQKFSTFVTKESYEKRSRALRIKESLIRLVAPIL